MSRVKFSAAFANDIFDILEEDVGTHRAKRHEFVHWLISDHYGNEFRIMGSLGFGGKLWVDDLRPTLTVDCYREDYTAERRETIKRTNARLAERVRKGP